MIILCNYSALFLIVLGAQALAAHQDALGRICLLGAALFQLLGLLLLVIKTRKDARDP